MIVLALAAAAAAQWTGPRTEEYKGPGYFCGGGYAIHLATGERALVLPQGQAPQATRLVLSGGEVNIRTGAQREPGHVVLKYGEARSIAPPASSGPNSSPKPFVVVARPEIAPRCWGGISLKRSPHASVITMPAAIATGKIIAK